MKPLLDDAWRAFVQAMDDHPSAQRIKRVRHEGLVPGGRTHMTLFERVDDEGRPHPRMRTRMEPAADPGPDAILDSGEGPPPADAKAFEAWLGERLSAARSRIDEVDPDLAPRGSERWYALSLRTQRIARFFRQAVERLEAWLEAGTFPAREATAARYALRSAESGAYSGELVFDDGNTDTYHSYGHDKPFVHYLESLLDSLPAEGSEAIALHDGEQQESLRRQREQIQRHLDWLMRHKYAHDGIRETDIERSLGGRLIDRRTREIVSESADSAASLVPVFELLRVDPGLAHPDAGVYVHWTADGGLRDREGRAVEVDPQHVRSIPVEPAQLTFERAPKSPLLRSGVRLDWDGNGYVQPGAIEWVGWAGHCDVKAIMEALGIVLEDRPSVTEYRSESGDRRTYDRDLLVEMIASTMELGSIYARADGSGRVRRGIQRFGGARNDSRPDRLQFQGPGPGRSFRWPLGGRQDAFRIVEIEADGESVDIDALFFRYVPDVDAVDFAPNPRFLETIEGDYNLVSVTGARVVAEIQEDRFDSTSGYPVQSSRRVTLDLTDAPSEARYFLGTHIDDAEERRVFRVWLDRPRHRIEAIPYRYELRDGRYRPRRVAGETIVLPLARPLSVTLSREMKQDDPEMFQSLLDAAFRRGENICADTDWKAAVWNGVVTRLASRRTADNREARVEAWEVDVVARFGQASLGWLVRRDVRGEPETFCPVPNREAWRPTPDFLWQDLPDVGSKGVEGADWVINETMLERSIVEMRVEPSAPGGIYVYDDHVKNTFELIYCGLAGYGWTVLHGNKRYGFRDEAAWRGAVEELERLRAAIRFEGEATAVA